MADDPRSGGDASNVFGDLLRTQTEMATAFLGHLMPGLKMPAGVESVALSKGDDLTIATIVVQRQLTAEEEAALAAADSAAPSAADVPTTAQKAKEDEPAKDAKKDDKKK